MAEWNRSKNLCSKCNSQLYRITNSSTGELIAKHCKWCGERLPTPEEQERMEQHQREAQDGIVGERAREERMKQRLEFKDTFNPYMKRQSRTKWVKSGYRRRIKVKKLFILAGICFIITSLILLLGGW